jgi:hypothetical protein
MTLHVKDGGVWKEVTAPSVRDGGVWKAIKQGWVRDGGTWKKFYDVPLAVEVSPAAVIEAFSNGASPQSIGFTASVSGGVPSYSYSWGVTSVGSGSLIITGSTTSSSCTVQASGTDAECLGTVTCTVTDADSTVVAEGAPITVLFGTPP